MQVVKKIFALSGFFLSLNSYAYWDHGHQLIGALADKKITQKTQEQIKKLLSVSLSYPGSDELSKNTSSIDTAASWADSIKSYRDQSTSNLYSSCHYTDVPLRKDQISKEVDEQQVMIYLKEELQKKNLNSINCLKGTIVTLSSERESLNNKAFALRMMIHIVGDIGQPLHNSELREQNFEDAGGNNIGLDRVVSIGNIDGSSAAQNNLHKIWDAGLGAYLQFSYDPNASKKGIYSVEERKSVQYDANDIFKNKLIDQSSYLTASDLEDGNKVSIENWVIDSYKIATKFVYSDLTYTNFAGAKQGSLFSASWKMYQSDRKNMIDIQYKKSGERLANLLNAVFDPAKKNNSYGKMIQEILKDGNNKPLLIK